MSTLDPSISAEHLDNVTDKRNEQVSSYKTLCMIQQGQDINPDSELISTTTCTV